MKRQILVTGLLSFTAVSIITGCVDDKYDLKDIDTTSRFIVDNLTVPLNLSEIKLENVVNLDDNENISTIDGKYAISKSGEIAPTEFSIGGVHVEAPTISSTSLSVTIPGASGIELPELNLPAIELPASNKTDYSFDMNGVDKALEVLYGVNTTPITVNVVLSIPPDIAKAGNNVSFQNLEIQLPWGLIGVGEGYDPETGILKVGELNVDSEGKASLSFNATGLQLGDKGTLEEGKLSISGQVGILGGSLKIYVKNTLVPSILDINTDYDVSSFDIKSFNGKIDYQMDNIEIDPISLSDLPDFLDNAETNIIIANPQILVNFRNPVGKYGLSGTGVISLTSEFKNGQSVDYDSDPFTLSGEESNLAFCTEKAGYTPVRFDGLRNVLSNGNSGLPSSIKVNIHDIRFSGEVKDFPLGDLGSAAGAYEFNAPLGFGDGSKVVYESTESGWSSDDLDKVNITHISLKAKCSTNLPVSVKLEVFPVDKKGNEIAIDENAGKFHVPAMAKDENVELIISAKNGGSISDFDGVRFVATVEQNDGNTAAIGPDLFINLSELRVTVDGYYDTDF